MISILNDAQTQSSVDYEHIDESNHGFQHDYFGASQTKLLDVNPNYNTRDYFGFHFMTKSVSQFNNNNGDNNVGVDVYQELVIPIIVSNSIPSYTNITSDINYELTDITQYQSVAGVPTDPIFGSVKYSFYGQVNKPIYIMTMLAPHYLFDLSVNMKNKALPFRRSGVLSRITQAMAMLADDV